MSDESNLVVQLCELEMLMSMFPGRDELLFDDPSELADLQTEVESSDSNANCFTSIGFTIHLSVNQHIIELAFRLPRNYPPEVPSVCLRLPTLNGVLQRQLSTRLLNFIAERLKDKSSAGVLNEAISWVQDEVAVVEAPKQSRFDADVVQSSLFQQNPCDFSRLWIYSHHIYNRAKRRTILDRARELKLSGFCAPGKPGVICVEGLRRHADDFWAHIRSLQWQRITLVHREDSTTTSLSDFETMRRFNSFDEQCFESPGGSGGGGHGTHMDRGQLLRFLVEHNCSDVFQIYFGVSGNRELTASSEK